VLVIEVELADAVPICENELPFVERSMRKPLSFGELSVHRNVILLDDTAVAVRARCIGPLDPNLGARQGCGGNAGRCGRLGRRSRLSIEVDRLSRAPV
jgi:hypothetical protein